MRLGYNTNGLAHHRLVDAIDLLAEEGYQSVAITLDAGALDPYDEPSHLARQVQQVRSRLDRHGLACVVETGARYLLNPREKHDPTLLDTVPTRALQRIDFLRRAIDLAAELGAEAVSLRSGASPAGSGTFDQTMDRLVASLQPVLSRAEARRVPLAFKPEPGMFIDSLGSFKRLDDRIRHELFQLTVDVGHVHCNEDGEVEDHLRAWGSRIVNIHIEDMLRGVHEHLMFGEGTIDFSAVLGALHEIGYGRGLHVELSRHSHSAVTSVRESAAFLRSKMGNW